MGRLVVFEAFWSFWTWIQIVDCWGKPDSYLISVRLLVAF